MFELGQDTLECGTLVELSSSANPPVRVPDNGWERIDFFRSQVDQVVKSGDTIYGVNTGFGFLSDVPIDSHQLDQLQLNLIRSHACGVGPFLAPEIVRSLIISRCHSFALGYSGVSNSCIKKMLEFLKNDIMPLVPSQGSVGASGDLAPLAHLAQGFVGEGLCEFKGKKIPVVQALEACGIDPLMPMAKEGLSLINGTQVMTVLAAKGVVLAGRLLDVANLAASLSLDAIRGTLTAFDPRIHEVRKHPGQREICRSVMELFEGHDEIVRSHRECDRVQDPYSFRCVPQVHGATLDTVKHVEMVVERELNSVTDNPLIFENGDFLSGGNFHGQPVSIASDCLSIAIAELGSISECRLETMTNPTLSGLPPFIIENSGVNSGFMIPHVVAASLVSENKGLCHPASVDSIPTSADKEDHVSMGTIAARKSIQVAENVANVLAIELLAAAQGIDLLHPLKPAPKLRRAIAKIREICPFAKEDRSFHEEIVNLSHLILSGKLWREIS